MSNSSKSGIFHNPVTISETEAEIVLSISLENGLSPKQALVSHLQEKIYSAIKENKIGAGAKWEPHYARISISPFSIEKEGLEELLSEVHDFYLENDFVFPSVLSDAFESRKKIMDVAKSKVNKAVMALSIYYNIFTPIMMLLKNRIDPNFNAGKTYDFIIELDEDFNTVGELKFYSPNLGVRAYTDFRSTAYNAEWAANIRQNTLNAVALHEIYHNVLMHNTRGEHDKAYQVIRDLHEEIDQLSLTKYTTDEKVIPMSEWEPEDQHKIKTLQAMRNIQNIAMDKPINIAIQTASQNSSFNIGKKICLDQAIEYNKEFNKYTDGGHQFADLPSPLANYFGSVVYPDRNDSDTKTSEEWFIEDNTEENIKKYLEWPSLDEHGSQNEEKAEATRRTEIFERAMQTIRDSAKNAPGGPTDSFFRILNALDQIPVFIDWRLLLKRYIKAGIKNQKTWQRINTRTFAAAGQIRPARKSDAIKIVIAGDTSGSMLDQLGDVVTNVEKIVKTFGSYFFTFFAVDEDITSEEVFSNSKKFTVDRLVKNFKGGGGTDFTSFFKELDNRDNRDTVVMVTDGCATIPESKPKGYDVIWVVRESDFRWAEQYLKWGKVVVMSGI
jgi:predicted metal-dependent peptidase